MNGAFDSESIRIFLAVLDQGSFSAAARQLGRVPSAISMAIANLEAELALELFDRSSREPRATAVARALEPQARLLVNQLQQLNTQALELSQGLEAQLTLAIAPELQLTSWLTPIATLAREYPLLTIQIMTAPQNDALDLLHSGTAQLALVFERPAADGRENFQEVGRETLVAVIAHKHPLLLQQPEASSINASELHPVRQIVVSGRHSDSNFCTFSEHQWRVDNPEIALQLIVAELGWGWLPRSLVQPWINGKLLRELPLANLTNSETLWIDVVWSRERPLGLGGQRLVALMTEKYQSLS